MVAPPPELAHAAAAFDAGWLASRRWFRAKRRALDGVAVEDAAPIGAADAWLLVLAARYADGGPADAYLVPAVVRGDLVREPADGEGAWRALVRLTALGADLRGVRGRFRLEPTPILEALLPSAPEAADALEERRLRVEQTNSSVVLGERMILKVYRLLEPGVNADVEMVGFLTDAGFPHTPPLAGSATYSPPDGEPCAALMLQAFVAARGDAWGWLLGELAGGRGAADAALDGIRLIGAVTAELHLALASRPDLPAFPARPVGPAERRAWHESARGQLAGALASLAGRDRERLTRIATVLEERMAAIGGAGRAEVSRIHGDYHLGQLLAGDGRFWVIDFEGEPARTPAERRRPASPLRDVAGMLRSLDYAARTAERGGWGAPGAPESWLAAARGALLDGYRAGGAALGPAEEPLLAAFELEKACYEVRYEAAMRPEWLWLPLDALERLAAG